MGEEGLNEIVTNSGKKKTYTTTTKQEKQKFACLRKINRNLFRLPVHASSTKEKGSHLLLRDPDVVGTREVPHWSRLVYHKGSVCTFSAESHDLTVWCATCPFNIVSELIHLAPSRNSPSRRPRRISNNGSAVIVPGIAACWPGQHQQMTQ